MSDVKSAPKSTGFFCKVATGYHTVALIFFNTFLLFFLFNVGLFVIFLFRGPEAGRNVNPQAIYPEAKLSAVYPDLTRQEWIRLLHESWSRPYMYDDYVLFKERPYRGRYVNVSEQGFRFTKDQGPWPPSETNLNIFVFGGSTTFCYGLPDYQTLPSFLQEVFSKALGRAVKVYNFGTGWYHSTQERILFERLLCRGFRPHIVIFIDGLNEVMRGDDQPAFRDQFQRQFDTGNGERILNALITPTPTGRALRALNRRLQKATAQNSEKQREESRNLVKRYEVNKVLIEGMCRQYAITPVFVWQPAPGYKYNASYHLFAQPEGFPLQQSGYSEMAKLFESGKLGSNFVWCADLQEHEKEALYVDALHYTAKFSQSLAQAIANLCVTRDLLGTAVRSMTARRQSPGDSYALTK